MTTRQHTSPEAQALHQGSKKPLNLLVVTNVGENIGFAKLAAELGELTNSNVTLFYHTSRAFVASADCILLTVSAHQANAFIAKNLELFKQTKPIILLPKECLNHLNLASRSSGLKLVGITKEPYSNSAQQFADELSKQRQPAGR